MFDNLEVRKGFYLEDTITGNKIEVCTFNGIVNVESGMTLNVNINYPNLYKAHTQVITEQYMNFMAEVTSMAVTMGISTVVVGNSTLEEYKEVTEECKMIVKDLITDVINNLKDENHTAVNDMTNMVDQYAPVNYR